ncbi:MAG: hypothetical protein JW384_01821 [Nitrosomonadaceae bacterium]|nr:hypothetical protein [Nitrosomonadaceae bacterium]
MGVMSASGGICSVLADHAADAGIEIPELSNPVQRRLAEVIPEVGSTQNPVDLSANVIAREEILAGTLDVLRTTKEVGTWVVFGRPILDRFHKRIADEGKLFEGNLIACSGVGLGAETADSLRDGGVPVVEDPEYCIRAIGRLASRRPLPEGTITPRGSALRRSFGNQIADQQRVYNTLLRHGLPVTRSHFFKSIADLQAATRAENFRFPLVVKAAMPQIPHKTAANCVVLNVQDIPSLELAAANVIYNARRAAPEAEILIEIQEMSAFRHAIILTVTQDRDFGPMIMIGLAGVGIDLIDDVQILLFPATREAFLHALQRLKAWPLLAGLRGAKPCDVTALANIHDGITELYRAETWIGEIKLSPILVGEIGCGAVLVDALVIEVD